MSINVPFLMPKDKDVRITGEMELAAAFLYFDENRPESIKSIFSRSPRDKVSCIARGIYTLRAERLMEGDKLYWIFDSIIPGREAIELNCSLNADLKLDLEAVNNMEIQDKINALENIVRELKSGRKAVIENGNLLYGYENLDDAFKGAGEDNLYSISAEFRGEDKSSSSVVVVDTIHKIKESIEKEIEMLKSLCILDDNIFKNSISHRNKIYEEFKDKIYKADREVSANIAALIVEREGKIRETEKTYSDKCAYLAQDYIFNKNKYDIAKIYGNETEMDLYRRSMIDAEEKIEKFKKEAGEEIKKLEKHYDNLLENEKKKIKATLKERDEKVKECEDLYSKAHSITDELKGLVSSDVFVRRGEIERIRGWTCKLDGAEGDIQYISIPFYFAQYGQEDIKYRLFFPSELEEKNKFISLISGIRGKIPLPFGVRHKLFEGISNKLRDALKDDKSSCIKDKLSSCSLIEMEGMCQRVQEGLKYLFEAGYLNDKNYEKSSASIKSMFSME